MNTDNLKKIIFTSLTSVGCGVIVGLLFAPDKGSRTREKITQKGDEYLKDMKSDIADIRKFLLNQTDSTRNDSKKKSGKKKQAANSSGQSSYENWTKDELYERAKEMDIAGRSTMNKSELIEALRNS